MKKLLCAIALLVAFQPAVFAQPPAHTSRSHSTTVNRHPTVVHRPAHSERRVVVRNRPHHVERRVVVRPHHPMVRCRDGVLRRDRPGACRGHGGRR